MHRTASCLNEHFHFHQIFKEEKLRKRVSRTFDQTRQDLISGAWLKTCSAFVVSLRDEMLENEPPLGVDAW